MSKEPGVLRTFFTLKDGTTYKLVVYSQSKEFELENKNDEFDEYFGTYRYFELTLQVLINWMHDMPENWEEVEEQLILNIRSNE